MLQFDKLILLCKYINHLAAHLSQEYLMILLNFCCSRQIQVHQTWQDDEERRVEIINNIIKAKLGHLVPFDNITYKMSSILHVEICKLTPCERFHDHLVNWSQKVEFRFFKEFEYPFPNPEFIQIFHSFLECVKSAISIFPIIMLGCRFCQTEATPLRRIFATNSPEFGFVAFKPTVSKKCTTQFSLSLT